MLASDFCKLIDDLQQEYRLSISQIARKMQISVETLEEYRVSGAPVFMHVTRATVLKELSEERNRAA